MNRTTPREDTKPVAAGNETLMLPISGPSDRSGLSQPTPPSSGDVKSGEATVFRPLGPPPPPPLKAEAKVAGGEDFDPLEHMVLKPRRGKMPLGGTAPQAPGPHPDQLDTRALEPMEKPAFNALEGAAAHLLALVPQLRAGVRGSDPGTLRERLVAGLDAFDAQVKGAGYDVTTRSSAGYALCALLDEAVLSTPWGSAGGWDQQSLLQLRHRSRRGAQGFLELLRVAMQNPGANLDLLELMYLCLCFGFFTQADQAQTRESLYRTIKAQRGGSEPAPGLSGHWQGVAAKDGVPLWRRMPPWGLAGVCAALVGGLFMVLSFLLQQDLDRVTAVLDGSVHAVEPLSSLPGRPGRMSAAAVADKTAAPGRALPAPP